ncbi:hypothetical protein ES703_72308 [subsurface metagenome]
MDLMSRDNKFTFTIHDKLCLAPLGKNHLNIARQRGGQLCLSRFFYLLEEFN